uniref:RNA polymerase beta subunit n=1 Tax=Trentepohlia sp. BN17 TaxID=3063876 RepID=UPI001EDEFEA3|nr:RNA polymerase beta subunit [Trentepohlia sp. BN17]UIB38764.1 RNA polymerase beta subunit [Trentepohlia sp. BN17]
MLKKKLKYIKNTNNINILNTHWLPYRKSYKATCINKIPTCLENSWLQKGDLLVNGGSSINGELALGRNLFLIYMPWEGYNFEDAILISDRVAQAYSTIYVEEFSIKITQNELVSNIIEPKTYVNQGDILVLKKRKVENNFLINRLLLGMEQLKKNSLSTLSSRSMVKNESERIREGTNQETEKDSYTLTIYVASTKQLQIGDKMSGRHGNKGIVSKILPFFDMPYLIDGTPIDIVLNPLGVPSRMNVGQIYESLLGFAGFYKNEYFRVPPFDENYDFQFSRNLVYWQLNELNQQHYDNYDSTQTSFTDHLNQNFALTMRLNQKMDGVRSWLNKSKKTCIVYEFLFPWSLRKRRNEMFSKITERQGSFCSKIKFGGGENKFIIFKAPDKNQAALFPFTPQISPQKLKPKTKSKGRAPKRSSFYTVGKAPKKQIPIRAKIGLNPYFPGKMRLFDGQTGETFFRPVIIGKSYMLKLMCGLLRYSNVKNGRYSFIHLVDNKIHARATGPYALITQQPLKGKRNQGGQRVGEMEVWALYAFGSASLLFEMLTTKSDEERILREIAGLPKDPGDKGISEAFRVLVMNLRSLCLDLSVFKVRVGREY